MADPALRRASLQRSSRQLLFFVLSGCIAAVVDYGAYRLLLAADVEPSLARAGSYIAGSTTAFLLNRRWAFDGDGSRSEALRGAVTYLVVFGVIVGSNWAFLCAFGSWSGAVFWAWFLSQGIGTSLNFLLQKLFVFRARSDTSARRG